MTVVNKPPEPLIQNMTVQLNHTELPHQNNSMYIPIGSRNQHPRQKSTPENMAHTNPGYVTILGTCLSIAVFIGVCQVTIWHWRGNDIKPQIASSLAHLIVTLLSGRSEIICAFGRRLFVTALWRFVSMRWEWWMSGLVNMLVGARRATMLSDNYQLL